MTQKKLRWFEFWDLVRRQHGVITRLQLLELGLTTEAIEHRLARGRLHRIHRGVYAVGRPEVGQRGNWMAAVLSCGSRALLSHESAATLWGFWARPHGVDVLVPEGKVRRRPGICVHRRVGLGPEQRRVIDGIPVTDPISTLIDLAACVGHDRFDRAVNDADRLDLVDSEALRFALDATPPRPGVGRLRSLLDSHTFAPTDSVLERRFLRLTRNAGLPQPKTQAEVNGVRVDFYWPNLGLVVETDGLRYHRTPAQQKKDHQRDQIHAVAGLTTLRFTAAQVRYEPDRVRRTLATIAARLARARSKHFQGYDPEKVSID
jgi:very-short-patch-repair endonuclease